jgi:hypothetical protein
MEQTEDTARTRRTELYEKWLASPAAEAAFEEWVREGAVGAGDGLADPGMGADEYLLFGAHDGDDEGGWYDLIGTFPSLDAAKSAIDADAVWGFWAHIAHRGTVVSTFYSDTSEDPGEWEAAR